MTSGVDETSTDLPAGGGGLRPPGDSFVPNLAMGGASYKVPLDLPSGPGGVTPKLDLSYHTDGGSGGFGVGWMLSLPYIERKRGTGANYTVSGGQDLVPTDDGRYVPFLAEQVQHYAYDGTQWTTQTSDLQRMRFGSTANSRVEGHRWLLDQITYPTGLTLDIDYLSDGAQRYVSALRWSVFQLEFHWEERPDPFSVFGAGLELRTRLRCASIELHRQGLPVSTLMRRYTLGYTQAPYTNASLLMSVQLSGWRADDGGVLREYPLRPLTLEYTPFTPERASFHKMTSTTVAPPPLSDTTTLFDYRGTALPGVLQMDGGSATYWENRGGYRWGPPETLGQMPPVSLADPGVHFADLTGTGTADLVVDGNQLYPNDPEQGLQAPRTLTLAPTFDLGDPVSFLVDLDGDRVADLLTFRNGAPIGCLNRDGRSWSQPFGLSTDGLTGLDPDSGRVRFADMNGDGVIDMVMLRSRQITYWPYLGNGTWAAPRQMGGTPDFDVDAHVVQLTDVNDDGCADLIVADAHTLRVYLNRGGEAFAEPLVFDRAPLLPQGATLMADMNGSGTAGLVWAAGADYWTLDLLGGQKPHLLARIDNGYGSVTSIEYSTSTLERVRDLDAGRRWTGYLPLCVPVVTRMSTVDVVTGIGSSTSYRYHDGHYDRYAHEYLGFGQVDSIRAATEQEEAVTQRMYFHQRGASALDPGFLAGQGQARRTELLDPSGALRKVEEVTWEAHPVPATRPAWLAVQTAKSSVRSQGGIDYESERVAYELDAIGNVVRETRTGADTLVIETRYATHPAYGVTSLPCAQYKLDGAGKLLKAMRTYYDGDPLIGLPLGQVTQGHRSRISEIVLTQSEVDTVYGGSQPLLDQLLRKESDPRFGTTWVRDAYRFRVDSLGNHLEIRNATDCDRSFEYDADQVHPVRISENGGPWRDFTFDPYAQQLRRMVDRRGNLLVVGYDGLGAIVTVSRPGAVAGKPTEVCEYDRSNVPQRRIQRVRMEPDDAEPGHVTYEYLDGSGAVIQKRVACADGRWAVARQQLIGDGRRILRETAAYYSDSPTFDATPAASVRKVFHDFAGRPVRETLFSGAYTVHEYHGNQIRFFDPIAAAAREHDPTTPCTRANYLDAWSRLVAIEESDEAGVYTQRRTLDALGRIVSIADPLGHAVLSTVYDLADNKLRIDSADCGRSVALFDASDHEVQRTDADGRATFFERGPCGRVEAVRSGGPQGTVRERLTYDDATSMLSRVDGDFGTAQYSYNAAGDPIEIRRSYGGSPDTYTVRFGYNTQRQLTSLTYPDGTVVRYERDATGMQTAIPGYIDAISYTAGGSRERIRYHHGLETVRGYSPGDELLTAITTTRLSDGATFQDLAYHLDAIGQVTAIDDTATVTGKMRNPQTFAYDRRGRLSRATGRAGTDYVYGYRYDALGNLTYSDEAYRQAVLFGHDVGDTTHPNRLVKRASAPGPEWAYDASGNLVSDPDLGTLGYDERGRLTGIVKPDGVRLEFVYDHNDRRVITRRTDTHGVTTMRLEVEGIYLVEPGRTVKVIFDEDKRLAVVPSNGDALVHHLDRLGNVNVISNLATGAFVGQHEYTPYGQLSIDVTIMPAFTVHGAEFTTDTDIVLLGARYYRPVLGRFLTGDLYLTINQDKISGFIVGAHLYAYAYDNPVNYTDPTGQFVFLVVLLIAVVVGGIIGGVAAAMNGVSTWDEFLLWVVAGMIGGAAACFGFYGLGVLLGISGACALANFTFWAVVGWSALGLLGALATPAMDKSNSTFWWAVSFALKWIHSPILTTIGLFVVLGSWIGGQKIDFRRGMIFVETGSGSSALTLGAIAYTEKGLWNGNQVLDLLAQHESVHSRNVAAVGELGFYITYAIGGFWGAAQAGDWGGFFGLNTSGCGNPLEKRAWSIRGGNGYPVPETSASSC